MDIAELGIKIDSTGAVQSVTALDKLTGAAGRAETATQQLATASTKQMVPALTGVGKASILTGNSARMLSQQLSQVGQQTMATGNLVQALAIQLPDIGVGFGAAGAAAGLFAGIALPMVVNAFTSTASAADAYEARLEALSEAIDSYSEAMKAAALSSEEMIATYGRLAETAGQALSAMAAAEQFAAIQALNAELKDLSDTFASASALWKSDGVIPSGFADGLNMSAEAAGRLLTLLDQVAQQERWGTISTQADAAQAVADHLRAAYGTYSQMPAQAQALYNHVNATVAAAAQLGSMVDDSNRGFADMVIAAVNTTNAMADLVAMAPQAGWLQGAISDAGTLAASLWDAAQAAAEAQGLGGVDARGQGTEFGEGTRARQRPRRAPVEGQIAATGKAVGRGGGGRADTYKADLDALVKSLQTEREVLDAWYEESQAILADRRAIELLGVEEHKAALLALETDYQEQVAAVQAEAEQQRLSSMSSLFSSIADIASVGGKRMVKAVALAEAIAGTINAYGAAIKALNTPGLTPMQRFAAYASVLAAGLKGVAAIKAAGGTGGGGGSGGSTPAAQGAASGEAAAPTGRLVVQGIKLTDIFTGQMLMDMLGEELQARGVEFIR